MANSWVGDYSLTQVAIWSPSHSYDFHAFYPNYMKTVLFPDQPVVTLAMVPGGLSTERQFNVNYRGVSTTMRINLENGVVFVPLQNSGADCSAEREIYWRTAAGGSFARAATSTVALVAPLPVLAAGTTIANRGAYSIAIAGTTTGNIITIGLDDDVDEYGRGNGYCTWARRVVLRLTKI